jgi:hypothetical protein
MMLSTGTPRSEVLQRLAVMADEGKLPERYAVRVIDRDIAAIVARWREQSAPTAAAAREREIGRLLRILPRLEVGEKWAAHAQHLRLLHDLLGIQAPRKVDVGGTLGIQGEHALAAVGSEEEARQLLVRIEERVKQRLAGVEASAGTLLLPGEMTADSHGMAPSDAAG